ncbi:Superfamily II DNA and RNA helicase [Giardia muris]|uniref:ATP-dependent RNA helicase n=1 Tax=Giardia muris TaxID=5742 RepID=A0A4Z1SRM8_GIAMU|nr:Superfamily II DNA and RNA helicase [Giardia muris]|eukprot:TNJ28390.1 Superfamily II DNA and RNA helicase [Giardia muris]
MTNDLMRTLPSTFQENLKRAGYKSLYPIQELVLEQWFHGQNPRDHLLHSMADNLFIASATGSGKTFAAILPLVIEAYAGLEFTAIYVTPTQHLADQVHTFLQALLQGLPEVTVLKGTDCIDASIFEAPALLKLDERVLSQPPDTELTSKDIKRIIRGFERALDAYTPSFADIVRYADDHCSYFVTATPTTATSLFLSIQNLDFGDRLPKLRTVLVDEADHMLLSDRSMFFRLMRDFFAQKQSTAVMRVPRYLNKYLVQQRPTDRLVFLSATLKYRSSLLENLQIHGGAMIDFAATGVPITLSPNVIHTLMRFAHPQTEIDLLFFVWRWLECAHEDSLRTQDRLPCIIFCNTRIAQENVACLLLLFSLRTFGHIRQNIVQVVEDSPFERPGFSARLTLTNEFLEETPNTIVIALDSMARGMNWPALRSTVNFDLPEAETTLAHRVGRCTRGTTRGQAMSLVRAENEIVYEYIEEQSVVVDVPDEDLLEYSKVGPFTLTNDDLIDISNALQGRGDLSLDKFYDQHVN